MAINDTFCLDNALSSQSYAYKCWYNYNYGGNTMGIPAEDMGQITQTWNGQLENWKAIAEKDDNDYKIDDDDYQNVKQDGVDEAKERTEFDGEADDTDGAVGMNWTGGAIGAAATIVATIAACAKKTSKLKVAMGSLWAAIGALAIGIKLLTSAAWLKVNKPNKDAAKACDDMKQMFNEEVKPDLQQAQDDMETAREDAEKLADEADKNAKDANKTIKKNKTDFDSDKASFEELIAKRDSGIPLTEDEKASLESYGNSMTNSNTAIDEAAEEVEDLNTEIYSDMEVIQDDYDAAAEVMADAEGKTEFAQGFDEGTKDNAGDIKNSACLGAIGSAGVVEVGIMSIAQAGLNWYQYAIGGAATAAGITSGILFASVMNDQSDYKARASAEIDVRKDTQELNTDTLDQYDESLSDYEAALTFTDELDIEVPKDKNDMDTFVENINSFINPEGGNDGVEGGNTNTPDPVTVTTSGSGDNSDKDTEPDDKDV